MPLLFPSYPTEQNWVLGNKQEDEGPYRALPAFVYVVVLLLAAERNR